MNRLMDLWKKQELYNSRLLPVAEICPICPGQVLLASLHQVHMHLQSPQHRDKEEQLTASLHSKEGQGAVLSA